MNEIVRLTDKPANPIDALRSEKAKEARRLSEALDGQSGSSMEKLAEAVAGAELMVDRPEYRALVSTLQTTLEPASVTDIKRELGVLFACYPARDVDIGVLVACAVDDVIREQPSVLRLLLSVRRIRRTCKFRPSIAEIIEALEDVGSAITKAREIVELPKRLAEGVPRLQGLVEIALREVTELLSDRMRRLDSEKSVSGVDLQLRCVRDKLTNVLAHRVTKLEPLRPLIIQSTTITEYEKAQTRWW
jgi:hypothetical protein